MPLVPATTPRLGMKRWSGSDPFKRQDFVDLADLLDQYPGTFVCTSASRPTGWGAAQTGQLIVEEDTGRILRWTGTGWGAPENYGKGLRGYQALNITTYGPLCMVATPPVNLTTFVTTRPMVLDILAVVRGSFNVLEYSSSGGTLFGLSAVLKVDGVVANLSPTTTLSGGGYWNPWDGASATLPNYAAQPWLSPIVASAHVEPGTHTLSFQPAYIISGTASGQNYVRVGATSYQISFMES